MWSARIRHAARETGKFLSRSYGTARKWAQTFDHMFDVGHRVASAVAPILDQHGGRSWPRKSGKVTTITLPYAPESWERTITALLWAISSQEL